MRFFTLFLLLLLLGCEENPLQSDPEFDPFLNSFDEAATERGVSIDLSSVTLYLSEELQTAIHGQCIQYASGKSEIRIRRQYWNSASFWEKELLVYHELGHCILQRSHDDSTDDMGHCESIMRTSASTCRLEYSAGNREIWLDELFSVQ